MNIQFEYDRHYFPSAPVLEMRVDGYSTAMDGSVVVRAIIDSGADGTMIPTQVLNRIQADYIDSVRMSGVTGVAEQRDRYRIRIQIGDIIIHGIDAVAISTNDDALIGRDVLNQLVVTLDGLAAETRITD